jgi:hypothetical protein
MQLVSDHRMVFMGDAETVIGCVDAHLKGRGWNTVHHDTSIEMGQTVLEHGPVNNRVNLTVSCSRHGDYTLKAALVDWDVTVASVDEQLRLMHFVMRLNQRASRGVRWNLNEACDALSIEATRLLVDSLAPLHLCHLVDNMLFAIAMEYARCMRLLQLRPWSSPATSNIDIPAASHSGTKCLRSYRTAGDEHPTLSLEDKNYKRQRVV